jgi:PPP family 3-phenylpropionic acid transporter
MRQLILFQLIAFGSFAPMNYFNVYLIHIGFDSRRIGLWGSIGGLIAMLSLPVWGVISDKIRSPKKTYLISMAVYALLFMLLPAVGKAAGGSCLPLYTLIVFYYLVKQPTHSLQDAWFMGLCRAGGIQYTSIRLWGSAGFAAISILIGLAVDYTGIDFAFYPAPLLILPLSLLCLRFRDADYLREPGVQKPAPEKLRPWVLLKNYYFVTALIMTVALAAYGALTASFYAYILEHAGVSPEKYGLISGYGAFVQVGCMLVITRYGRRAAPHRLLVTAGFFSVAENILYGTAGSLWMMFVAATLWGVAMSINVSVLPSYIYSLVPRQYNATAQSLSGTVTMLLAIVGNLIGGYLISVIGIAGYNFIVAAFQLLLTGLFVLSIPFGRRVLKIPLPDTMTGTD